MAPETELVTGPQGASEGSIQEKSNSQHRSSQENRARDTNTSPTTKLKMSRGPGLSLNRASGLKGLGGAEGPR